MLVHNSNATRSGIGLHKYYCLLYVLVSFLVVLAKYHKEVSAGRRVYFANGTFHCGGVSMEPGVES